MNTVDSPMRSKKARARNGQLLRAIQTASRIFTAIFILALLWTIYEAVVNENPLPAWAWLGMLVLFAVVTGLGVAILVYRGVRGETGPFDLRPPTHVSGELLSETERVEIAGASTLQADVRMTQGVLRLEGGTTGAMEAEFIYDDADWKRPEVLYDVDDSGQGKLFIRQLATHRPAMRQGRSEWDLRLNQELPTSLNVRFGAGKAELMVGGMALKHLRVESGVGELVVDLSGVWRQSMEAFIKAGIGDTVVRLPQDVGVCVRSTVGLGSIRDDVLSWNGESYTNALYRSTEIALDITIEGGIGKVELVHAS